MRALNLANLLTIFASILLVTANLTVAKAAGELLPQDYLKVTPQGININMAKYCTDTNQSSSQGCLFKYRSIEVKVDCSSGGFKEDNSKYMSCEDFIRVTTNLPMTQIISPVLIGTSYHEGATLERKSSGNGYSNTMTYSPVDNVRYVSIWEGAAREWYVSYFSAVTVMYGKPDNIYDAFVVNKITLLQAFELVLDRTLDFQNEIARSHQGHLDRYIQALKDGIAILKDEKGYSVLDWRVEESSRRVMVFGMVISEILDEYSHVTRLHEQISAIKTLTSEIRKTYGWSRGVAGEVSKASGALLELVELELSEIAKIKLEVGYSNLKVYSDLLKAVKKLLAKVDASKSGDMAAQRDIYDFLDAWNAPSWQNELNSLIEAQVDFKRLVSQKLNILLTTVASISDLTKMDFEIPVVK